MKKYYVGIIDDTEDECNSIKRTIYTNKETDCEIIFKVYEPTNSNLINDNLLDKIQEDIVNNQLMILIIDNKLIVNGATLLGTTIYEQLKKITKQFPIIIMTNYVEDAYRNDYVDPDKVYAKSLFFKNGEYTKEKVKSIFLCIEKYNNLKTKIIAEEERLVLEYEKSSSCNHQKTINELMKTELEKKEYTPADITYLEELLSVERVKEIITLLDELNDKI